MKLTFLGTRGNIAARSSVHRMHSSVMVSGRSGRVLIDYGADWLGRVPPLHPAGLFVTHAHPDHVGGLRWGSGCAVYATADTWEHMARWPLPDRRVLRPRYPIVVAGLQVEAWPVEHAVNAPAVGYRVSAGGVGIFYVPDIARLPDPSRALSGVDLYVGDGATMARPLVRRRGSALIGHTTIGTQLSWCAAAGVRRAIFTHCGSGIVGADPGRIEERIRAMGRSCGAEAHVAHDGMVIHIRRTPGREAR